MTTPDGAELGEREQPNARFSRVLETFNYGAATTGTSAESTHWTEPTIPIGTPVTYVHDLKAKRNVTYYQQPETGMQIIQISDETADPLIRHGYWIKPSETAPLLHQSYVGGHSGGLAREATDDEVTAVTDHLEALNEWYARTRETDLSSPTERQLRKAITDLLDIDPQPSIVNVEKMGGKDGGIEYTTVTILNHDLYLKVLGHDNHEKPNVRIELDGALVPENLRKKIILIEVPGEVSGVFDDQITYGGAEPKNRLFYPDKPQTESPGEHPASYPIIDEPEATLKEADAVFLISLLESYSQRSAVVADTAHERDTPADAVMLEACRRKLGELLIAREAKDEWSFQGRSTVLASFIKPAPKPVKRRLRQLPQDRYAAVMTIDGDLIRDDYRVQIGGSDVPDSLRNLQLDLDYSASEFHVRFSEEDVAEEAGFPARVKWLASQLQIRELVEFIDSNT